MTSQHVIDPVACIACEICIHMCPSSAVMEIASRIVIDPDMCDGSALCLDVCPTGANRHWIDTTETGRITPSEQATWSQLPAGATSAPEAERSAA